MSREDYGHQAIIQDLRDAAYRKLSQEKMPLSRKFQIRLPVDLHDQLETQARAEGLTLSAYLRRIATLALAQQQKENEG